MLRYFLIKITKQKKPSFLNLTNMNFTRNSIMKTLKDKNSLHLETNSKN